MDNYEINILRRDGNWKKVKPNDFLLDTVNKNDPQNKILNTDTGVDLESSKQDNFLYYINKVNLIIGKLENLENEKTELKNQLEIFEKEFDSKKKDNDEKIRLMSTESEMLDKTINIIKNLKKF
jgi:hypothetical protein